MAAGPSCEPPGGHVQARATSVTGHARRVTSPINSGCISGWIDKGFCFAISSCFVQQEISAFEPWLLVDEVSGWTPQREGSGEVEHPNLRATVRRSNVGPCFPVEGCVC